MQDMFGLIFAYCTHTHTWTVSRFGFGQVLLRWPLRVGQPCGQLAGVAGTGVVLEL